MIEQGSQDRAARDDHPTGPPQQGPAASWLARHRLDLAVALIVVAGGVFLVHHLFFDGGILFLALAIVFLVAALALNTTPAGSGINRHPYDAHRR